jgi:molecular chaperone GrpE
MKKSKTKELEELCNKYLNGWKKERADFMNYKKEEMERIKGLIQYATEEMILNMLPILDNFNIAEKGIPQELKKDSHIKGLLQIKNQILGFLKAKGVKEIKAVGSDFDPNFHEVVEEVKGKKPGIITEEVKKGYTINNKLLRPTLVKVSK